MGVLVILSLVYKRHRETPKRPWRIWCVSTLHVYRVSHPQGHGRSFDVSKQVIGQMFVHGVNVLISDVVAHLSTTNPCVLYFLNILIDTTLGESLFQRVRAVPILRLFIFSRCRDNILHHSRCYIRPCREIPFEGIRVWSIRKPTFVELLGPSSRRLCFCPHNNEGSRYSSLRDMAWDFQAWRMASWFPGA